MRAPESDTIAWSRARSRRLLELAAAVAACVGLTVMFGVFCSILTR